MREGRRWDAKACKAKCFDAVVVQELVDLDEFSAAGNFCGAGCNVLVL